MASKNITPGGEVIVYDSGIYYGKPESLDGQIIAKGYVSQDGSLVKGFQVISTARIGVGQYTIQINDNPNNEEGIIFATVIDLGVGNIISAASGGGAGNYQIRVIDRLGAAADVDFQFIVCRSE